MTYESIYRNLKVRNDLLVENDLDVSGDFSVTGTFTFGDAAADNFILKGRTSTMTAAGSAVQIDATTSQYGEGMELRYNVSD